MSEQPESQPFGRNTCHICGGTDFEWGRLLDRERTNFLSDENADKILDAMFYQEVVRARKCNTCQNVQIFVASEK